VLQLKDAINAVPAERNTYTLTISEPEGMHVKIDFGLPEWTGPEMLSDNPPANTVNLENGLIFCLLSAL